MLSMRDWLFCIVNRVYLPGIVPAFRIGGFLLSAVRTDNFIVAGLHRRPIIFARYRHPVSLRASPLSWCSNLTDFPVQLPKLHVIARSNATWQSVPLFRCKNTLFQKIIKNSLFFKKGVDIFISLRYNGKAVCEMLL